MLPVAGWTCGVELVVAAGLTPGLVGAEGLDDGVALVDGLAEVV